MSNAQARSRINTGKSANVSPQKKSEHNGRNKMDPAASRLLGHLAGDGASAMESEFGRPGALDIFANRKGVTLRVAGSTIAAAEALVRNDLAFWTSHGASARQYLEITATGRSHQKRAADGADGFLAQHGERQAMDMDVDGVHSDVIVDASESPLAWLARRKGADGKTMIDVVQLEAGERLRRDLELAQMLPRVTVSWNAGGGNSNRGDGQQHITDMMIAARQRVHAALDAVGSDCAGILVDVCGFLKGLRTVEFERAWPRRSAKVVLGIALSALAKHYGLAAQATGPKSGGGLQHWGTSDFRPELFGNCEPQSTHAPPA